MSAPAHTDPSPPTAKEGEEEWIDNALSTYQDNDSLLDATTVDTPPDAPQAPLHDNMVDNAMAHELSAAERLPVLG